MPKLLSLTFVIASSLYGQTYTGSIRGRIADSATLPIAGAQVVATQNQYQHETKNGYKRLRRLLALVLKSGTYEIQIEAKGFKPQVETCIQLELNQSLSLAVQLEVGATTDRVDVSADAVEINEVSSEIGHVIDSHVFSICLW